MNATPSLDPIMARLLYLEEAVKRLEELHKTTVSESVASDGVSASVVVQEETYHEKKILNTYPFVSHPFPFEEAK